MLSTIHYVWAFLMCFGIRHDHFLTSFFPWNSTDSLDGTGKLLCSCLLQSPGFVFNVLNKYYEQNVTSIHPSFPLPAVGSEDKYMLQGVLKNARAPTFLVKMQVPLVTMLMQVRCHSLTWI